MLSLVKKRRDEFKIVHYNAVNQTRVEQRSETRSLKDNFSLDKCLANVQLLHVVTIRTRLFVFVDYYLGPE